MAKASSLDHEQVLENLQKAGTLSRKTVVHIVKSTDVNDEQAATPSINNHGSALPSLEERMLILSDNTQIIVESVNEFMLIGPTGAKIILSSLPLFLLPDQPQQHSSLTSGDEGRGAWMQLSTNTGANFDTCEVIINDTSQTNGTTDHLNTTGTATMDSNSSLDTFLDPLPRLDDVFTSNDSTDDNVFTYLDPFNQKPHSDSIILEESTRDKVINTAFTAATTTTGSDDRDLTDSDDNYIDDPPSTPLSVNYVDSLPVNKRTASISFVKISSSKRESLTSNTTTAPTYLPPAPIMLLPRYETKSGWLIKLSHRRGVFGDKWQKRYFILNGSVLSYFKKYGDSHPRGTIKLLPGSWCNSVIQGSPRMTDAVAKSDKAGIISVNRCLGVHRPNNFSASLSALLASEGAVDAFSSLTVALNNPSDASRTFYMIAPSEQERHSWVDAICHNIQAYARSQEALDTACNELQSMLQAVGCTVAKDTLPSILLSLHSKRDIVAKKQMDFL